MKLNLKILLAAFFVNCYLVLPALAQDSSKSLSLEQAIAIAIANNKSIPVAKQVVVKSKEQVRAAKAGDNPQLKLQGNYIWQGPTVELELPNQNEGDPPTKVKISQPIQKGASATLTNVIDAFGQVRLGVSIAEYQQAIAELELAKTIDQLTLQVKQAYYDVLRAEAQKEVAVLSLEAANQHLRIAEAQFKAGTVAQFDVTRAQVEVANKKQNLIAVDNAVKLAKSVLNNVMGIDVNTQYDIQKVEVPVTRDISEALVSVNTEKAYTSRPEVLASQIGITLAEKAVELNKRGLWPTLIGTAQGVWNGSATAFASETSWNAGLVLSFPIWDGGITKSKVNQARSDLEIAKAQAEQLKLVVALEVRSAILRLIETSERVATAAENIREAKEALRLAQVRYEAGISTAVEVTDAEVALTLARLNEVNANYEYRLALAQLERAIGAKPILDAKSARAESGS